MFDMWFNSRFHCANDDVRVYAQVTRTVLTIVRRLNTLNNLGCLQRGWPEVDVSSIMS